MITKPKVLIDIFCGHERGEWINPGLLNRLFESLADSAKERPIIFSVTCGVRPVDRARNQSVERFLSTDATWLVMIDSDIFPPAYFLKIVQFAEESGKCVIGLPYPIIMENGPTLSVAHETDNPSLCCSLKDLPEGWKEVDYAGTGLMAIRRDVVKAVTSPWFEFTPTMGEDFNFCHKARKAGFQIWTHGSFVCDHLKTYSLLDILRKDCRLRMTER